MKKSLVLFLVFSLVFCGCGTQSSTTGGEESGKQTESSESTTQNTENETQNSVSEESEIAEPVEVELTDEIRAMIAPMDGFMMYAVENEFVYDAADPEVFWSILFYTIGNYGGNSQFSEIDGEYLNVDRKEVHEYAKGAFADYSDLPEIPESLQNNVIYDADRDVYKFALGDRGLSSAELIRCMEYEDGSYDVIARLFDVSDNQTICTVKFHLVENKYAEENTYPIFEYAISSVEEVME